jgi:hypothetical protein
MEITTAEINNQVQRSNTGMYKEPKINSRHIWKAKSGKGSAE